MVQVGKAGVEEAPPLLGRGSAVGEGGGRPGFGDTARNVDNLDGVLVVLWLLSPSSVPPLLAGSSGPFPLAEANPATKDHVKLCVAGYSYIASASRSIGKNEDPEEQQNIFI